MVVEPRIMTEVEATPNIQLELPRLHKLRAIILWGHLGLLALLFALQFTVGWPSRPVFSMLAIFLLIFTALEWIMLTVLIMRMKNKSTTKHQV